MMITVDEAKQRIISNTSRSNILLRDVESSVGYVLASDVRAPMSLPSFRQSSMDGYAVMHADITGSGVSLRITAESKAGGRDMKMLDHGCAIRIFTGAPVPEGATAVIMQENTSILNGTVTINEFPVFEGKNIRNIGQQITEGAIALPGGTNLTAGSIGFLLGMNIQQVEVYGKLKVGILVTGDELLQKGEPAEHGKVYESNSAMLVAALKQEGITEIEVRYSRDELASTIDSLKELGARNDLILASGGISVGDYDFVGKALEALSAEIIFYKVRQKPGKPLLFAKQGEKLFFALPGNPASSLVCYYEYVLPAIRKMAGRQDFFLRKLKMPAKHAYSFQGDRDEFLKAIAEEEFVVPLDGQESFALKSFAIANAIIYLPVSQQHVAEGDLVEVHLLPH